MSKADNFVPNAIQRVRSIKAQLVALQSEAISLRTEYVQQGGDTMDGLATFDFTPYGISLAEFQAGMLDTSAPHNAVALSTIYSSNAYDDVTKLAIG